MGSSTRPPGIGVRRAARCCTAAHDAHHREPAGVLVLVARPSALPGRHIRRPRGLPFGQKRRASRSSTMITGGAARAVLILEEAALARAHPHRLEVPGVTTTLWGEISDSPGCIS